MNKILSQSSLGALSALALLLTPAVGPIAQAQSIIPSGTMTGVTAGGGLFAYTLTISDSASATASIGSIWFAWIPGQFYLVSNPSSLVPPTGWTETQVLKSIQLGSTGAGFDIAPGQSQTFTFKSPDSPAVMYGNAVGHPGTPIGTSVAYSDEGFSSGPVTFVLTPTPEPSTLTLVAVGALGMFYASRRLHLARN